MCKLQWLPIGIVVLVLVTTTITFYVAVCHLKHVTYFWPYISDTGTFPPESCIFGQALNIVSFLLVLAMYVKYRQVQEMYQKHHIEETYSLNKVTFCAGFLACVGISLVANFQETNVFTVHWFGAILAFGIGSLYECLQTIIYIKISPIIGQRKTTMFRIILSAISLISFIVFTATAFVAYGQFTGDDVTKWTQEDGGFTAHQISTIAEWICASSTMLYILLFYPEFKSISLGHVPIILEEQKLTSHTNVTLKY